RLAEETPDGEGEQEERRRDPRQGRAHVDRHPYPGRVKDGRRQPKYPRPGDVRRLDRLHPGGQRLQIPLPEDELAAALLAAFGQMGLQLVEIVAVQRAQRVGGEELLQAGGVGRRAHAWALNACRSLFIPSRMRDLTVPRGASRRSAICVWVSPSKKASSMQRRW